ncbi:MAG TPA: hypothetical protein VLQ65_03020 [Saliniramus sp.]|nr:hypothetical protein [Saliniramus sp.]
MPILDASVLDVARADAEILRGVLGPVTHGPRHAEEMREAARRAGSFQERESRRETNVSNAIRSTERAGRVLLHRLHSSV